MYELDKFDQLLPGLHMQHQTPVRGDMRRKCLELLSEPDLKKIAVDIFKKSYLDVFFKLDDGMSFNDF